mmetsp:Transcript_58802/g.136838  ORF Transcript_58802/g.136838 Transcript_58802/m.136838 type:complete len:241 (+) Transcript_58802:869-1591(+)
MQHLPTARRWGATGWAGAWNGGPFRALHETASLVLTGVVVRVGAVSEILERQGVLVQALSTTLPRLTKSTPLGTGANATRHGVKRDSGRARRTVATLSTITWARGARSRIPPANQRTGATAGPRVWGPSRVLSTTQRIAATCLSGAMRTATVVMSTPRVRGAPQRENLAPAGTKSGAPSRTFRGTGTGRRQRAVRVGAVCGRVPTSPARWNSSGAGFEKRTPSCGGSSVALARWTRRAAS